MVEYIKTTRIKKETLHHMQFFKMKENPCETIAVKGNEGQ